MDLALAPQGNAAPIDPDDAGTVAVPVKSRWVYASNESDRTCGLSLVRPPELPQMECEMPL